MEQSFRVFELKSTGLYALEPLLAVEKPEGVISIYARVSPEEVARLGGAAGRADVAALEETARGLKEVTEFVRSLAAEELLGGRRQLALLGPSGTTGASYSSPAGACEGGDTGELAGLKRAFDLGPQGVLAEIERHGLEASGARAKTVAESWRTFAQCAEGPKYVILRGFDPHPWTRTARLLWESDPQLLLEGFLIASYAVGAAHGFVCVGAGDPTPSVSVGEIVRRLAALGVRLGESATGEFEGAVGKFALDVDEKELPVLLVLGEDTALASAVAGRQPLPYVRTEESAALALLDGVCLVIDALTAAKVACLLRESGTLTEKAVCTVWDENAPICTVVVPLDTSLGEVVERAGQVACLGCLDQQWKEGIGALQVGGPTGPLLAADDLALPLSAAVEGQGVMLSCSIRLFREGCAVERSLELMSYLHSQSCGQCVFCREGTFQIVRILRALTEANANPKDLDLMRELGEAMLGSSICSIGNEAPRPLLSSLRLFLPDFEAHADSRGCPRARP